jgi:hypothetical protein
LNRWKLHRRVEVQQRQPLQLGWSWSMRVSHITTTTSSGDYATPLDGRGAAICHRPSLEGDLERFLSRRQGWLGGIAGRKIRKPIAMSCTNWILADFVIGAHASANGCRLLTLDYGLYRSSFPTLAVETF